ncbi:unnamed protein product [Xylocopa violacea]|uniref:Uncharacterized protein n=1 Tax=Xylocopa violacea TaxID=135666 RepID=A0ABP1P8M2_XYLVO
MMAFRKHYNLKMHQCEIMYIYPSSVGYTHRICYVHHGGSLGRKRVKGSLLLARARISCASQTSTQFCVIDPWNEKFHSFLISIRRSYG